MLYELQHFCGCALRNGEVKHGDLPKEDSHRHMLVLTGMPLERYFRTRKEFLSGVPHKVTDILAFPVCSDHALVCQTIM